MSTPPRDDSALADDRPRDDAPPALPDGRDASSPGSSSAFWNGDTREMARARETFIGSYRVDLKVGEGGMGVVYKAYDDALDRFVALKVLKEKLAHNDRYLMRLKREARAVAAVSHPAVIQIFAFEDGSSPESEGSDQLASGRSSGLPYLVMEYVEGESLDARLRAGEIVDVKEAVRLTREAARGLEAAQERGIVHRDIKPSNLLVSRSGALKIVDFGLSKDLEADASITDDGIVLGTPHYISPEQGQGRPVDHRSDIYSLGATLYHMLTGRPVFDGDSHGAVIYAHIHTPPRPPHEISSRVPHAVSFVVGKMLAKDPALRYGSYKELIDDLDRLERGESLGKETTRLAAQTYRPPWWRSKAAFWFVAGLAVSTCVALALLVALAWWRYVQPSPAERVIASYVESSTPERDVVRFDFRALARGESSEAEFGRLFYVPALRDGSRPSLHPGRGLTCSEQSPPIELRYAVERLDELTLTGLNLRGSGNLAISLRHPDGEQIQHLYVTVAGDGERSAAVERPITAWRRAERFALRPSPPPLPALIRGAYELTIALREERGDTFVTLRVSRLGASVDRLRDEIYPPLGGDVAYTLAGTGWNRGVLSFRVESPLSSAPSFSLQSIKLVGRISRHRLAANLGRGIDPITGAEVRS